MLTLQETYKQRIDNSESASDSVSVSDCETITLVPHQNEKKRQLSTVQKIKQYSKKRALWFTRTQFEELVIRTLFM